MLKVANDPAHFLIAVLGDSADRAKLKPLLKEDWGDEKLALGESVVYMWCANGILESKLATAVSRAVGHALTARNWATVLKLHALIENAR